MEYISHIYIYIYIWYLSTGFFICLIFFHLFLNPIPSFYQNETSETLSHVSEESMSIIQLLL